MDAWHIFSGGGGGTFGLKDAGIKVKVAIDNCKYSAAAHRFLFPDTLMIEDSVENLTEEMLLAYPRPDIVLGGPPCPNFSAIGDRSGIAGDSGRLSFEFTRITGIVKSPFLLVENVPGMVSSNKGKDFLRFIAELDAAGYSGAAGIINGEHYVPQMRKRMYLQAVHKNNQSVNSTRTKFCPWIPSANGLPTILKYWEDRLSSIDWRSLKTVNLPFVKNYWEDYGDIAGLNFVCWSNGELAAFKATFDKFPYTSVSLPDLLEENAIGLKVSGKGGGRKYFSVAPTFRGMNLREGATYRQPGTGIYKVIEASGEYRSIYPIEAERLMGWPENSSKEGATGNEKKEFSNTQRVKLLAKGMIPASITSCCDPFLEINAMLNTDGITLREVEVEVAEIEIVPAEAFAMLQEDVPVAEEESRVEDSVTLPKKSKSVKKKPTESKFVSPLKWAGRKHWLVCWMREKAGTEISDRRWFDPFIGSAELPLALGLKNVHASDSVWGLINLWKVVQAGELTFLEETPSREDYEQVRSRFNEQEGIRSGLNHWAAAAFYYLNRCGHHGLCRHNRAGEFNVPVETSKGARVLSFDTNIISSLMQGWEFKWQDFDVSLSENLRPDDFLFLDSPYFGVFDNYDGQNFAWSKHLQVVDFAGNHPGPVVVCNSNSEEIIELYRHHDFQIEMMDVNHLMGKNNRGKKEMLAWKNL